ncbi:endonuclease domain-containing protein [Betaproteobacteria bacterium PRO7]|nr:endonuclease domain-containing protein [Betaproteobacteria bacterium PRO7]
MRETAKSPRALRARPPLRKGAELSPRGEPPQSDTANPPLKKGGQGGFRGLHYRSDLKPLARQLRSNLTDAERALWQRLRGKQIEGVQFYRQRPIGRYIVDFYAPAVRLVVELDGGQHFEADEQARDVERDEALRALGLGVLRFDNRQVLTQMEAVLERIHRGVCEGLRNPPCPPLRKGGDL